MANRDDVFKEKLITMRTAEEIKRRRWDLSEGAKMKFIKYDRIGVVYFQKINYTI